MLLEYWLSAAVISLAKGVFIALAGSVHSYLDLAESVTLLTIDE